MPLFFAFLSHRILSSFAFSYIKWNIKVKRTWKHSQCITILMYTTTIFFLMLFLGMRFWKGRLQLFAVKQTIAKVGALNNNNHLFSSEICKLGRVVWTTAHLSWWGLGDPYLRWLIHLAGKLVLAFGWEFSQSCVLGTFLSSWVSPWGCLGFITAWQQAFMSEF